MPENADRREQDDYGARENAMTTTDAENSTVRGNKQKTYLTAAYGDRQY